MDKLKCCIAEDLMPLYIDNVLSEGSAQALRDHLRMCEGCRKEYQTLTKELLLPANREIQMEDSRMLKKFKSKWTIRKILISMVSAVLAVLVFFTAREYIMEESELFQPKTRAMAGTVGQLYLGELSQGEWTRLTMLKEDLFSNMTYYGQPYLKFNNPFYEKQVVNSGNSATAVEMRILDVKGNVVLEPFVVDAGAEVSLEELKYGVPYIVEYKATGDYYVFTFH